MLPENQVTQGSCSAEPSAAGQALGLPLGSSLPPKQGGTQGGAGSTGGCGVSRETRGEAGLIYEQAVMGPLGKVGTHDRP